MTHVLIDPNLPLCWEDQVTLRVGFEEAYARLHDPSPGAQRLLFALLRGIDPDHVAQAARTVGLPEHEARSIMSALAPALVTPTQLAMPADSVPTPTLNIAVCDDGREVPGLIPALAGTGLCQLNYEFARQQPDLVIYVERFLEPLERAQHWLMAGISHLLVRFTDTAVHVGPLVVAPGAPCHACITLELVARDRAYPVLAAQLARVTPRSETAAVAGVAVGFAGTLIRDWLAGHALAHSTRVVIPTNQGRMSGPPRFETVTAMPECACTLA